MRLHRNLLCVLLGLALVAAPRRAESAITTLISYQGFLKDVSGNPINSTLTLTFSLFSGPTGGTALWSEVHTGVVIAGGIFSVQLGSVMAFPPDLFLNSGLWLETNVAGAVVTPRVQLGATPYAFHAAVADSVVGGPGMRHFVTRLGSQVTSNGGISTSAFCLAGEVATGGGAVTSAASGGQVNVTSSRPQPETAGTTPTSWRITATNVTATGTITVQAFVICASP
jgi:hypothetical protein